MHILFIVGCALNRGKKREQLVRPAKINQNGETKLICLNYAGQEIPSRSKINSHQVYSTSVLSTPINFLQNSHFTLSHLTAQLLDYPTHNEVERVQKELNELFHLQFQK